MFFHGILPQVVIVAYSWITFDELKFNHLYASILSQESFTNLSAVSALLPIVFCVSLLSLLHFHSYLAWTGMTTFEWILAKRRKQAQKRLDRIKQRRKKERGEKKDRGLSIMRHQIVEKAASSADVEAANAANLFQQKYDEYHEAVKQIETGLPDFQELMEQGHAGRTNHVHTKGMVIGEDD